MVLPEGVAMVEITGTLFTAGELSVGQIEFLPSTRVVHIDEQMTILPALWVTKLVNGEIPVGFKLPANDDGNPSLGTYRVTERVNGLTHVHPYNILVLSTNGPVQDLSNLAPVPTSDGVAVVVGPQGPAGGPIYIQEDQPVMETPGLWVELNPNDSIKTMWIGTT